MKKLNKKHLDEVIELTRRYWSKDETDEGVLNCLSKQKIRAAQMLGSNWFAFVNLVDGIFSLNPDASSWDVYIILRSLGWEVTDEEVEES